MSYVYPPHYEDVKAWTRTQKFVTFTTLQTQFNLTYGRSILVLEALQREHVIMPHSDNQGRYAVYISNRKKVNKMPYQEGKIWVPEKHICSANKNNIEISTYMQGVNPAWLLCENTEWDDEPINIIYEIKYCPFCGKNLGKAKYKE